MFMRGNVEIDQVKLECRYKIPTHTLKTNGGLSVLVALL